MNRKTESNFLLQMLPTHNHLFNNFTTGRHSQNKKTNNATFCVTNFQGDIELMARKKFKLVEKF